MQGHHHLSKPRSRLTHTCGGWFIIRFDGQSLQTGAASSFSRSPQNFYRVLSFLLLVAEEEETHKTGRGRRRAVIVAVLVGVWVFVSSGGEVLFGVLNAFPEEFISFMYF